MADGIPNDKEKLAATPVINNRKTAYLIGELENQSRPQLRVGN